MEKVCYKCKVSKPIELFPNDPKCSDGKRGTCKVCRITLWVPTENEILTCSKCGEQKSHLLFSNCGKQKPHQCKECRNASDLVKRRKNREEYNKKQRDFYDANKEEINATRRVNLQKRRDNDPKYRAMMALHCRLYMAVAHKKGKTIELTGCSHEALINHLESKFSEGMTWENYGKWHIDHIRPCASFDLTCAEQQRTCFNWVNLQPLWARDNIIKGCKWGS